MSYTLKMCIRDRYDSLDEAEMFKKTLAGAEVNVAIGLKMCIRDRIILDAPCSGEGMFRKLDQAVETWSIEKVNECAYIQRNLINSAYQMLKDEGLSLIHIFPVTNQDSNLLIQHHSQSLQQLDKKPPEKNLPQLDSHEPGILVSPLQ